MTEETITWLKSQHPWIQLAAERIISNNKIEPTDIDEFIKLIKIKIDPTKPVSTPEFLSTIREETGIEILRLDELRDIVGIDKLAPKNPLKFGNDQLAVIYGNNGSGKSGYTRLLKVICGKEPQNSLKHNIFLPPPIEKKCTITYTENGKQIEQVWKTGQSVIPALTAVDIFDTANGRIYLDTETGLSYTPKELEIFSSLVEICKKVDSALEQEQSKFIKRLPLIPQQYSQTSAGKLFGAIKPPTNGEEILTNFTWTILDETRAQEIRIQLSQTNPAALAAKIRAQKEQTSNLRIAISNANTLLGPENLTRIQTLAIDAITKRKIATDSAAILQKSTELPGFASITWMALWEAARQYSMQSAYISNEFPYIGENSKCILCQQELSNEASNRLLEFEGFVLGTIETQASEAEKLKIDAINQLPRIPTLEILNSAILAADATDEIGLALNQGWKILDEIKSKTIASPEICSRSDKDISFEKLISDLLLSEQTLDEKIANLELDMKGFNRELTTTELLELDAKKWTFEQATSIQEEITRLQFIEEFKEWRKLTNSTSISVIAGKVAKKLITDSYIARFNTELKQLGASRISVELVKGGTKHGQTHHKIQLKGAVSTAKLGEILSEGEQRIIALAAFLADVTGKPNIAPFVFDDPISSLDQLFEEKMIDRLIQLSSHRQVLVFSHRLSFIGGLIDSAKKKAVEIIHIKSEQWGTGEPGTMPIFALKPESALKDLKCRFLAQARKIRSEHGEDAYYPLAKSICSDFRILIERCIELTLLCDVVQRHRRSINTLGKIHKLSKIDAADCDLMDTMMTKYSCYEHSQSTESPVIIPDPDELELDIQSVLEWHTQFSLKTK